MSQSHPFTYLLEPAFLEGRRRSPASRVRPGACTTGPAAPGPGAGGSAFRQVRAIGYRFERTYAAGFTGECGPDCNLFWGSVLNR
jgi:hypothetical protein